MAVLILGRFFTPEPWIWARRSSWRTGSARYLEAGPLVQVKLHDGEMSLRGILRGFGPKVGHTTPRSFEPRIRELVEGHPTLTTVADPGRFERSRQAGAHFGMTPKRH